MKSRTRRILRFVSVTAILATVAVLFVRGRDPSILSFHRPSAGEAALDRLLDDVVIEDRTISQAAQILSQKAGIHISVDAEMLADQDQFSVWLRADKTTLSAALANLCGQLNSQADYFPSDDGIKIVAANGASHWYLQAYDLRQPMSLGAAQERETKEEYTYSGVLYFPRYGIQWALLRQVPGDTEFVPPELLNVGSSRWGTSLVGGRLFAMGPFSVQEKIRRFIAGLGGTHPFSASDDVTGAEIACFEDGNWVALKRSRAERDLLQTIPALMIESRPLDKVIGLLERAGKTRITVDWRFLESNGVDRSIPVSIDRPPETLASALQGLFLWDGQEKADIHAAGDGIEIGTFQKSTRRYDLRKYFARFAKDERGRIARHLQAVLQQRQNGADEYEDVDDNTMAIIGSYLFVNDTWENQQAVAARLWKFLKDESASADLDIPQ